MTENCYRSIWVNVSTEPEEYSQSTNEDGFYVKEYYLFNPGVVGKYLKISSCNNNQNVNANTINI